MKNFLKMIKLEIMRVFRNKFVLIMLFCFPIILMGVVAIEGSETSYPVAIYYDQSNETSIEMVDKLFGGDKASKVIEVSSFAEGKKMMLNGKVCMFVCFDSSSDPMTAEIFYDSSSKVGAAVANSLDRTCTGYAYDNLQEFLADRGVTLKQTQFKPITFKPLSGYWLNTSQMVFALEIAVCVATVLLLGLAYSISRDNEFKVSNNMKYMPISEHKYLWSKIIPYLLLGGFLMLIMLLVGTWIFKISYQTNILLIFLFTLLFILATVMQGFLFNMLNNQISAMFLSLISIMLPIFVLLSAFVQSFPFYIKAIFDLFPIMPFVSLCEGLMHNGVVLWMDVLALFVQILVYYFIVLFIIRKKAEKA